MTSRLRPVPDTPPRAIAYLRQSIAREESISLELQETACRDYAARRGYQVIAVVADPGISGRTWKRPGVQAVMTAVEARECDVVLLWKWSRLSRSRRDWAIAADRVEVAGGRIESATEPVDVSTSTGRLTRGMLTELAAWESDVKSEQWKEAQARRHRLGLTHGGGRRFGYTYDPVAGHMPDPVEGPLLASMYGRYIAGEGFQRLAVALNGAGVRTMRGGAWTASTLLRQLDSGFAAGLLQTGTRARAVELIPGAHLPLIDAGTWAAYRGQRERLRKMPPRSRRPIYPLTGLVRCGHCLHALSVAGKRAASGEMWAGYLYSCTGHKQGIDCPGVWVKRATVEAAVLDQIRDIVGDVDARAATKTARVAARVTAKADRARLEREAAKLETALARLTVQVAKDLIPESAYRAARDELLEQQGAVGTGIASLTEDVQKLGVDVSALRGLLRDWGTMSAAARRDVLAPFVRQVRVFRDGGKVRVIVDAVQ